MASPSLLVLLDDIAAVLDDVAAIIKLDDLGYWLIKGAKPKSFKEKAGLSLIHAAPYLMKFLGLVGTIAMFLVGGGIIIGEIPLLIQLQSSLSASLAGSFLVHFVSIVYSFILGLIVGTFVLLGHVQFLKLTGKTHS